MRTLPYVSIHFVKEVKNLWEWAQVKLMHTFLLSLVATNAIYIFMRQSQELSLSLILTNGLIGGVICFILFMVRERKVLLEKRNKIPLENFFGLAILSLFVGFTVLTVPLVIELIRQ